MAFRHGSAAGRLDAKAQTQGTNHLVKLKWSPADGGTINVLRKWGCGSDNPPDDGQTQDKLGSTTGTFTYQVCETPSGDCSNEVVVVVH